MQCILTSRQTARLSREAFYSAILFGNDSLRAQVEIRRAYDVKFICSAEREKDRINSRRSGLRRGKTGNKTLVEAARCQRASL